jgi:hypothetical protein
VESLVGWVFSERFLGISQLETKTAGAAPPISHRAHTCICYISAYMFEELWFLANSYLNCRPVLDVYGAELVKQSLNREATRGAWQIVRRRLKEARMTREREKTDEDE